MLVPLVRSRRIRLPSVPRTCRSVAPVTATGIAISFRANTFRLTGSSHAANEGLTEGQRLLRKSPGAAAA